ncbi:MAG: Ig-like domain-containing protein [Halothece sp.]
MSLDFLNNEANGAIAQENLLENLINHTEQLLISFAQEDRFDSVLETAFATEQANLSIQSLQTGNFLDNLEVEIRSNTQLDGALGAYAASEKTIYLSQQFLTQASIEQATGVFLEEVGHAVDDFLNKTDTAGDEGAIFASFIQGNELSDQELASLRKEDDTATLEIDRETITVEQAQFTVTNTNDSGEGSLRSAIAQANSSQGEDSITFDSTLSGETINLTSGQLDIEDDLTLNGLGADQLTVNAGGNSRVMNINDSGTTLNVSISGLTISGGSVSVRGGGILNKENLTLSNSTVSGNSSQQYGGGIYSYQQGNLIVSQSTVSNNSADYNGGGITSEGSSFISNSTISGNSGELGGGLVAGDKTTVSNSIVSGNSTGVGGGAIANINGTTTVTNSTISGNSASGSSRSSGISGGGGIVNYDGTLNVKNSTVSGNSATIGGAIFNGATAFSASSTATIENSTISGNSATNGAGIYNYTYTGGSSTVTLANSIIANPSEGNDVVNESYLTAINEGTINTEGVNLVEDSSLTGERIINQDPNLSPLQDNGGLTLTQVPSEDSPVIDAGSNTAIPTDNLDFDGDGNTEENIPFDQRSAGFDRVVGDAVDLGAVEVQQPQQNMSPTASNDTFTTEEGTAFTTGNVLDNDSDPEDDSLSVTDLDTTETLGTITNNEDGTFDYNPNGQFEDLNEGETAADTFSYTVSDGNGNSDTATVTINIEGMNNQTPVALNLADFEAAEGNSNETATFTFTATLGQAPSQAVSVDFTTTEGTAAAGEDYESTSGTLTFEQGTTEQTIEIPIFGDNIEESDESFTIELSNPSNGLTLSNNTATGTIQDDDREMLPPANTVTILQQESPEVIPVSTGFFIDYAGTQDSTRTFNIESGAGAQNLDAGATVNLTGTSSEFDYLRNGSTLQIIDEEENLAAELLVSPDTTSRVSFDDGTTAVAVDESQITFGGLSFEDGEEIDGAMTELTLTKQASMTNHTVLSDDSTLLDESL